MTSGFVRDNALNLWVLARGDGAGVARVIVARTVGVGAPPPMWSGFAVFEQEVRVEVEDTLFGAAVDRGVRSIFVPVVDGSRTAAAKPGVAAWIAEPGARNVYFLSSDDRVAHEDLGVLSASDVELEDLRQMFSAAPPPGIDAALRELSLVAAEAPQIGRLFAGVDPAVLDFVRDGRSSVRLTLSAGALSVFSGIAYERAAAARGPDATLELDAPELARALTNEDALTKHVVAGASPKFLAALERAATELARNPAHAGRLRRACGD